MLIVNRSQPAANGIHISSLSFLGLLYTETEEQTKEIYDISPLQVLSKVTVPIFSGKQSNL